MSTDHTHDVTTCRYCGGSVPGEASCPAMATVACVARACCVETRAAHLPTLPDLRGKAAVHAASAHGAPLYVLNQQRGWVPAGTDALGRIARMEQETGPDAYLSIYGADSLAVSREQHCAGCWHRPYGNLVHGYGSKGAR